MSGEVIYSALRESIIKNMTDVVSVPVDFQPKGATTDELLQTAIQLGMINNVRVKVLEIDKRYELTDIVKIISSKGTEGKVDFFFNRDMISLGWILHNCICDSEGKPIFASGDLSIIVSKFEDLCLYLGWEALGANGYKREAEQDLVGNSEGTEPPSASSEPQVG